MNELENAITSVGQSLTLLTIDVALLSKIDTRNCKERFKHIERLEEMCARAEMLAAKIKLERFRIRSESMVVT